MRAPDNTVSDLELERTMEYSPPDRRIHRGVRNWTPALAIAAQLAAFMPPRESTLTRATVEPEPKTPERLAAAESKRARKAMKRLRNAT